MLLERESRRIELGPELSLPGTQRAPGHFPRIVGVDGHDGVERFARANLRERLLGSRPGVAVDLGLLLLVLLERVLGSGGHVQVLLDVTDLEELAPFAVLVLEGAPDVLFGDLAILLRKLLGEDLVARLLPEPPLPGVEAEPL